MGPCPSWPRHDHTRRCGRGTTKHPVVAGGVTKRPFTTGARPDSIERGGEIGCRGHLHVVGSWWRQGALADRTKRDGREDERGGLGRTLEGVTMSSITAMDASEPSIATGARPSTPSWQECFSLEN